MLWYPPHHVCYCFLQQRHILKLQIKRKLLPSKRAESHKSAMCSWAGAQVKHTKKLEGWHLCVRSSSQQPRFNKYWNMPSSQEAAKLCWMFATVDSYGIKYLMAQGDCFCTLSNLRDKSVMLPSHAAGHTALRHIFMFPQLSSYSKSCNQVVILPRTKFGRDRLWATNHWAALCESITYSPCCTVVLQGQAATVRPSQPGGTAESHDSDVSPRINP